MPGRPPALVRTDFERHEYASFAQPRGRGTWKARLLSDNKIWFGMNGPGQLACFNPITESYEDVPPHSPSTKNSHLTDVVEGPDGRLYMPGYPSGDCVVYDRSTGEYREVAVAESNHQLFAACLTDGGHIGILNGLQHGVYALDPRTDEVTVTSPPHLTGRPDAYSGFLRLGDQFLVTVGHPEGGIEICRFCALDLSFLGSFVVRTAVTSGRNLMASPEGRLYMSVDDGYLYAHRPETGSAQNSPAASLVFPAAATTIFWTRTGSSSPATPSITASVTSGPVNSIFTGRRSRIPPSASFPFCRPQPAISTARPIWAFPSHA